MLFIENPDKYTVMDSTHGISKIHNTYTHTHTKSEFLKERHYN